MAASVSAYSSLMVRGRRRGGEHDRDDDARAVLAGGAVESRATVGKTLLEVR
ncbi:hypothetical protein AB0L25_09895 [Spirillospora sp. NPDC052242]